MRLPRAAFVAVTGVALAMGTAALAATAPDVLFRTAAADSTGARRFDHRRHERVACTECHGTGEQHRTLLVRTASDCASCHHDAARRMECVTCHERSELPAARSVTTTLQLADSARTRALPFGHEPHAAIGCRDCHTESVMLAPGRTCTSCHTSHHRAEATCTSCHSGDVRATHQADAHLSCAGAGCHAAAATPPRTASRTLCLACHDKQRDHEPAGQCASCHQIPQRDTPRVRTKLKS